jgi:2'-5' RNA ligase
MRLAQTIRTFIAVDLPDSVRQSIRHYQEPLKQGGANVKWVRPENMHLTLKFLGDIPTDQQDAILRAMAESVRLFPPFSAVLSGSGGFPDLNHPRVFWIGIGHGAQELTDLSIRLNNALIPLGFEKDKRPYQAHLTLGRVRSMRGISTVAKRLEDPFASESFRVNEIILYKSDLNPAGSVYTVLDRAKMEG